MPEFARGKGWAALPEFASGHGARDLAARFRRTLRRCYIDRHADSLLIVRAADVAKR